MVLNEYVHMKVSAIHSDNMLSEDTYSLHQGLVDHVKQTRIAKHGVFAELDKLTANNTDPIDITFENVTFGYSATDILFRDFSYDFMPNKVYGKTFDIM